MCTATEMIVSRRLTLRPFILSDAADIFAGITPAVTRFLRWDPPASWEDYLQHVHTVHMEPTARLVIQERWTGAILGMGGIEDLDQPCPELGLWLRESAQGQGYGREVVAALMSWAHQALGKTQFLYPVATENWPSRRIAEGQGGVVIDHRRGPKYTAVVYRISIPG